MTATRRVENWSVNSTAASVELLREAALSSGFGMELFPAVEPRRWDGSDATDWRVSHDYVTGVFQAMRRESGASALGIRLAHHVVPRAFSNLIHLFMSSCTLGVALDRWVRFQALFTTANRLRLTFEGDRVRLSVSLADGALRTTPDQAEYGLGLMWRYIDGLTLGEVAPREVHLARGAGPAAAPYEDFFGAPVRPGMSCNALVFDREALQARSVHACLSAFIALERLVEAEALASQPHSAAARVSGALRVAGLGRSPQLADIAGHLRLSRRTLQRRLTQEGLSFSQLLDAHCRHVALEALQGDGLTNEDVAEQCGFLETRSFYRAFSRWTGTTPDRFRRQGPSSGRAAPGAEAPAGLRRAGR